MCIKSSFSYKRLKKYATKFCLAIESNSYSFITLNSIEGQIFELTARRRTINARYYFFFSSSGFCSSIPFVFSRSSSFSVSFPSALALSLFGLLTMALAVCLPVVFRMALMPRLSMLYAVTPTLTTDLMAVSVAWLASSPYLHRE